MSEPRSIAQTPTPYTANSGGREGENHAAGMGGTDPATFPIDPVELAVSRGHEAAIDLLEQVLRCQTVARADYLRRQAGIVILALQHVENAAANRADDLNVGGR